MERPASPVDPASLGRLRWRCRRGLLENDLLIERFFARHGDTLTTSQAEAISRLMDLADNDLLDLLLSRTEPAGALDQADIRAMLSLMRAAPPGHQPQANEHRPNRTS